MTEVKTISIDGVDYVRADTVKNYEQADKLDDMEYVIVRCDRSGVFAGYLKERDKQEAELINARRLWFWKGAASLSQLAMEGVSKPEECKFPIEVSKIYLIDVIEVIPATKKAQESIRGVKIWEA